MYRAGREACNGIGELHLLVEIARIMHADHMGIIEKEITADGESFTRSFVCIQSLDGFQESFGECRGTHQHIALIIDLDGAAAGVHFEIPEIFTNRAFGHIENRTQALGHPSPNWYAESGHCAAFHSPAAAASIVVPVRDAGYSY